MTPEKIPDAALLSTLEPVRELSPEHRAGLAQKGTVLALNAGQKLAAAQEHGRLLYVLNGRVDLSAGAALQVIQAGTVRACQPVFAEGRLKDSAVAVTPVRLLRLDARLVKILQENQSQSSYDIEDVELSDEEGVIFAQIYQDFTSGELELPALPEVAIKIREALKDPDIDIGTLARIVGADLGVTGGLLKAASSAVCGASNPVVSLRDAIARLGLDVTRRLVVTIALQQVFRTESHALRQRMRALWERSVQVSALSSVIARHCHGFDPEHALLAGLLHDVGAVPIIDHVGRHHAGISDEALDEIVLKLQPMVGQLLVGSWKLGPDIHRVVQDSGNWIRDPAPQPDECDLVVVARLYHLSQQPGRSTPIPRYDEVPAFRKLGLNVSSEGQQRDVIAEAQDEINEITTILKGGGQQTA